MALFSSNFGRFKLIDEDDPGFFEDSVCHYIDSDGNDIDMGSLVLYEGSDIKKIAKKDQVTYVEELQNFASVFTSDKGKIYYVKIN